MLDYCHKLYPQNELWNLNSTKKSNSGHARMAACSGGGQAAILAFGCSAAGVVAWGGWG
jgi:hypothetical protein